MAQRLGQPDGGEHLGVIRGQVQWPPQVTHGVGLKRRETDNQRKQSDVHA